MTSEFQNLSFNPQQYMGEDQVKIGDGTTMPMHHTGGSVISSSLHPLPLHNLRHVPSLTKNLVFVRQFCYDNNIYFESNPDYFFVKDSSTHTTLLRGPTKHGLYVFPTTTSAPPTACVGERTSVSSWHHRLGHHSLRLVQQVLSKFQLPVSTTTSSVCNACRLSKSHAFPFSSSTSCTTIPLELVHTDLWGPSPSPSPSHNISIFGFWYYVSFLNDYSRFTWIYLLKYKYEVYDVFLQFQRLVKNLFTTRIKCIY